MIVDEILTGVGSVAGATDDGTFSGTLVPYGQRIDREYGSVTVEAGAASAATRDPKRVKVLWQHDWNSPIGMMIELEETESALLGHGRITTSPSVPKAAEALALLREHVLDELSIGFDNHRFTPTDRGDGKLDVVHHAIKLRELSVVTFGAAGRSARVHNVNADRPDRFAEWAARFAALRVK